MEGEDLRGPVPLDTAPAYAREIAAGLAAAHEKGIVHCGLKTANIKATCDRQIKLPDFGFAKGTGPRDGKRVLLSLPVMAREIEANPDGVTRAKCRSRHGRIVGTHPTCLRASATAVASGAVGRPIKAESCRPLSNKAPCEAPTS